MKQSTKNRIRKNRKHRIPRGKGFLHEIDMVPVYRRFDKYTQETVKAAYFNDYCAAQIGVTWDDAMKVFQAFRYGYPRIQEYWHTLRRDFFAWAEANGIRGWGVHMFPDE